MDMEPEQVHGVLKGNATGEHLGLGDLELRDGLSIGGVRLRDLHDLRLHLIDARHDGRVGSLEIGHPRTGRRAELLQIVEP